MSDQSQRMLCKALELAEKSAEFYEGNLDACPDGLGREIFEVIREAERDHLDRVREIHEALTSGVSWGAACVLDEADEEDALVLFRGIAAQYKTDESCATEVEALSMALDLKLALVAFYEEWLEETEDETEREFVERMVQEQRGHYIMLSDLQYYYEDPEGWTLDQGGGSLDGA
ncbi:hypothetical protein [Desulfovibrio aminophilus]|uniref:hypothetical protein n=1 Tax=Desulfovibrio aminophilus TaxID=81425 RepID=UPI00339B313F